MDYLKLKSIIEGLLFLAGEEGLSAKQIADIVEQQQELVEKSLEDMKQDMEQGGRGLQIVRIAGHYQLATLSEHAPYFEKLAYSPARASLSQAALETLAIVAYRQPITRVEIEDIRGVKSERAIHTLVNKELIEEKGRAEAIGRYRFCMERRSHFWIISVWALWRICRSLSCLRTQIIWRKRHNCCSNVWRTASRL